MDKRVRVKDKEPAVPLAILAVVAIYLVALAFGLPQRGTAEIVAHLSTLPDGLFDLPTG